MPVVRRSSTKSETGLVRLPDSLLKQFRETAIFVNTVALGVTNGDASRQCVNRSLFNNSLDGIASSSVSAFLEELWNTKRKEHGSVLLLRYCVELESGPECRLCNLFPLLRSLLVKPI